MALLPYRGSSVSGMFVCKHAIVVNFKQKQLYAIYSQQHTKLFKIAKLCQ
jgi:hypothetical protein